MRSQFVGFAESLASGLADGFRRAETRFPPKLLSPKHFILPLLFKLHPSAISDHSIPNMRKHFCRAVASTPIGNPF